MIPWLKELLMTKAAFLSTARALLLVLGMVAQEGKLGLPVGMEWVGYALMGAAVFLRAGEKNTEPAR